MTQITLGNNPIKLSGSEMNEDNIAPNLTVLDNSLNQITLDDYKSKKKLVSVTSSVDTGVRGSQTRKFNEETSAEDGAVLTISVDLPFARRRWCASSRLDNVVTLSDHKDLSFGRNYGLMMDELRLLTRSVFVLNENNKIVYREIVSEDTNYPDFEATLKAYRNI